MDVPFEIDFSSAESLTNQVVQGFHAAIDHGVYRAGDRLPTIRTLAKTLGVSEMVVRAAYRQLASDGDVVGRTRLGSVVTPAKGIAWRGRVLALMTDYDFNPMMAVHFSRLRERFERGGYSFVQTMALCDSRRRRDYSSLELNVRHGVDFIVLLYGCEDIERHLSGLGIPFCIVGDSAGEYLPKGCVGRMGSSSKTAVGHFARDCVRCGVRTAKVVAARGDGLVAAVSAGLSAVGVAVSSLPVDTSYRAERRFESAFNRGFALARKVARQRRKLPDVFFVADDFIGSGFVHGLSAAGVRMPEDVGVVSYSNGGSGPFFDRPVTVIEHDAFVSGDHVADCILKYLRLHRPFPNEKYELVYRRGQTFGAKATASTLKNMI